jgi:DNA-binding NarL/FixJ family response regulator
MTSCSRFEVRPRVLIADDHDALLRKVTDLLSRDFQVVGVVHDGTELVAAEAALHPDVLIVDISMPGMSGIEATSRIRLRGSHAAVVCLTAYAEREIVDAALEAGALGYVVKTSMVHDLVPAIRAALEGHQFVSPPALAH